MHLLYLHQYFCPPGGSGNNRSYELARQWVAAGHRVTLLTSPAYFPDAARQEAPHYHFTVDGIEVHVLNVDYQHEMPFRARIRAWLRFYRQARRYAKQLERPDLIYASSTPLTVGELGRRLSQSWQLPFVFETVDVWPDVPIGMGIISSPFLIRWLNRRTDRIYRESAAVVALSEGMRDQVISHGVAPEKVTVIHNGTHPEAFPFVPRRSAAEVHVIYTGTVGIANGLDQVVDLAREIFRRGRNDIRFTIVGRGNDLARVKDYAQGTENLRFVDRVPKEEVAGLLAGADIGLVCFAPYPVLEANSANKFYDYLASGLPVLLNYQGWQAEYLRQYGGGLAVPQGDLSALAETLIRMADDPAGRQRMGEEGRRLVEAHFDRRELAEKLMALFHTVIR